jgi:hypothetical protein
LNGHQRSTGLPFKQDFREAHLAAGEADLHSQRGARSFGEARTLTLDNPVDSRA